MCIGFVYFFGFIICFGVIACFMNNDFGDVRAGRQLAYLFFMFAGLLFAMLFMKHDIEMDPIRSDQKLEPYRLDITEDSTGCDTTFYYDRSKTY